MSTTPPLDRRLPSIPQRKLSDQSGMTGEASHSEDSNSSDDTNGAPVTSAYNLSVRGGRSQQAFTNVTRSLSRSNSPSLRMPLARRATTDGAESVHFLQQPHQTQQQQQVYALEITDSDAAFREQSSAAIVSAGTSLGTGSSVAASFSGAAHGDSAPTLELSEEWLPEGDAAEHILVDGVTTVNTSNNLPAGQMQVLGK